MAANTKRTGLEWVGGIVKVPAYVWDDDEPYRPDVLFWVEEGGSVLGSTLAKPGELLPCAAENLQRTIAQPMVGHPHAPTRVRVASRDLADLLATAFPELHVVCAATPEIDALVTLMRERFDADAADEQSYLAAGTEVAAMSAFFSAAASLFRAQPWHNVPSDQSLLSVTIAQLGLHDAVLSVIGRLGESVGVVLFANTADFEAYLAAGASLEQGETPMLPPHLALNFERGAELATHLRKEIARHRWEVAGADAYPWLMAMDEDLVARPPTARELTIGEAVAWAVPQLISELRPALIAAWNGGAPVERTLQVATFAGDLAVTLRATDKFEPAALERASHIELANRIELTNAAEPREAAANCQRDYL
jgi:hypothetical protein